MVLKLDNTAQEKMQPCFVLGFDLWQVKGDNSVDNVILCDVEVDGLAKKSKIVDFGYIDKKIYSHPGFLGFGMWQVRDLQASKKRQKI